MSIWGAAYNAAKKADTAKGGYDTARSGLETIKTMQDSNATGADKGKAAVDTVAKGLDTAQPIPFISPFDRVGNWIKELIDFGTGVGDGNSLRDKQLRDILEGETPSDKEAREVRSPLAIDLDGNGIETSNIKNGVYFDIDSDGFAEKTAWLNAKDAFLAIDRNKNGVIDNATELFGDLTAENGFEALKAMDSNGDGVIDANDAGWEDLMLWIDAINDGVSQSEELVSVKDAGIERIELNYQEQNVTDENGNEHRQTATVYWQDGHTTVIEDIWFQTNQAQSIDLTGLNVSDEEWAELAELPYIDAFGDVHSLWVAMSLDACNDEFFTKSSDFQAA